MKTIVNKETNNWYYLKKKPTGGYFYSVAGLIVISLGLVLLVLGLLVIIDGDLDGLLLILPVVALFIIAYQLMKYGIFHSIPGWVRFNNEKVQLLARKNVTIEIEFDRNTRILPQFNHFLGGYNKYWGFVIIRNKKRIEVTPNLGFSIGKLKEVAIPLIRVCKERQVQFSNWWKYVKEYQFELKGIALVK